MIAHSSRASRKTVKSTLVAALAAAVWVVGALVPASASALFVRVGQFSGPGAGADQLTAPGKAEVRLSDQRLLVADAGNDRVQVFAPTAGGGTVEAPLTDVSVDAPHDVAIDQDNGEVYVADGDAIVRFTAAGTLDATFTPLTVTGPIDFDESTDELVVGDIATSTVRRYSRTGLPGTTFDGTDGSTALGTILDLAVDSTGDVLVVDATGNLVFLAAGLAMSTVERYSAAGAYEATVAPVATPTTVATEPTTDRVLVGGNIAASFAGTEPLKVSAFLQGGAAADSVDLPTDSGIQGSQISGVATGPVGGRMYAVTDLAIASGTVSVQAYDNLESPTVTDPVVSNLEGEQVDVSASIDPNGNATAWTLEYSADGGTSWTEVGSGTTGAGLDPETVGSTITGLQPTRSYLVRARLPLTSAISAEVAFQTPAVAPKVIMSEPAANVTTSGARLLGAVDPQGSATEYWFEYGTTSEYGSRIPATAVPAGGGNTWVAAGQNLTDLQSDTTYHYRLVAENAEGVTRSEARTFTTSVPGPVADSCPNANVRRQQGTTGLADCRAYEMVSPVHKFNGGVSQGFRAADDGSAVGYIMNAATGPDSPAHALIPTASRRTDSGWTTTGAAPPVHAERRGNGQVNSFAHDYSADFKTAYISTNDPIVPDDKEPVASGNYPGELSTGYDMFTFDLDSRQVERISRPHADVAAAYEAGGGIEYMGRSVDGEHVFFRASPKQLLPGVVDTVLYEYFDGEVRVVSRLPNGTPVQAQLAGFGIPQVAPVRRLQQISADGNRVYWQTSTSSPLYLRENGSETIVVSASRATATAGNPAGALYLGSSADGSVAYFYTTTALLDGVPARGVYRYDRDDDTLSFLFATTSTPVAAGASGYRPLVSESGDRAYFRSTAALTPGAVAGKPNLYLWDGALKLVAPTSSGSPYGDPRLRLTADGRYAVFTTSDSLGASHRQGVNEIYLYDAETGETECVSCRQDGAQSTRDAHLRPPDLVYAVLGAQERNEPRNVLDDGSVFFQSAEPLVGEDSNGVRDVYRFKDGELTLMSSGRGEQSELIDTSADGSSVFFITANAHTARDIDGGYPDVYVARVNGGFPEPDPAPERCSGSSCQQPGGAPGTAPIGSSDVSGADDPKPWTRVSLKAPAARSARGTRVVLSVRLSAAGRVAARGDGVRPVSRRASRAGTVRVPVRLTKAASARLARTGRVRTRVRLVFTRTGGGSASRVVAVTFKRPVKAGAGRAR